MGYAGILLLAVSTVLWVFACVQTIQLIDSFIKYRRQMKSYKQDYENLKKDQEKDYWSSDYH